MKCWQRRYRHLHPERGHQPISGSLSLGYNAAGSGTYTLSGGSLSAQYENVGYSGNGTFVQTGGTNTHS